MALHLPTQGRVNYYKTHSLCGIMVTATSLIGVIKMGNTAPRVRLEPTYLVIGTSVLTITPPRLRDVTTLPAPTCLCSSLPERSVHLTRTVPMEL